MNPEFKGYCKSCRFAGLQTPNMCGLAGWQITDTDFCSKHRRSVMTCDTCGRVIVSGGVYFDNHLICNHCLSLLGTCEICRFGNTCEFETNPSPLPKFVQKEIRQGNMSAVTQVMNPERIHITCEKGCKCFDKKNGCLKQIGSCPNGEIYYRD